MDPGAVPSTVWRCAQPPGPEHNPWIGETLRRREWQPTPVFLRGEFHGQRSLAGYGPQGNEESDMTEVM